MQITKFYQKHENKIIALVAVFLMALFVGFNFDYFYQANDDVYIKNLLAGVHTGTPESHNIQMHYPISLLLSVIYRIANNLPVYGLFLCGCHYGCSYLLLERSLMFAKKPLMKISIALLEGCLLIALLLPEFVFTQYTVTSAMLAGTAIFRFYTTNCVFQIEEGKQLIKKNIGNILLLVLAFCVRSEMLLLVFPFICVAGFLKWTQEKPMFMKQNAIPYFSIFSLILIGISLAQVIHMFAYSSNEWKAFTKFFDERTELYDYQFVPEYEKNQHFYEKIALEQSEQELLINYNFGLDERIDSEILRQTAEYAQTLKISNLSFIERFRGAFADYKYKTFHSVDYPWNVAVIAAYALLFLLAWKNKRYVYLWKIPVVLLVRTGLWMYIMMGNRYPNRITHSLYFVELLLLSALIFEECRKEQESARHGLKYAFTILAGIVFFMIAISAMPTSMEQVKAEMCLRENANREIQALDKYCKNNPDNFYFIDVYSAVSDAQSVEYSEKIFHDVDNSPANYDLMGGWVSKSPATDRKYHYFGILSMEKAILDSDNVYVIIKKERSMDWIKDYYDKKLGIIVTISPIDSICVDFKEIYTIYKISCEK